MQKTAIANRCSNLSYMLAVLYLLLYVMHLRIVFDHIVSYSLFVSSHVQHYLFLVTATTNCRTSSMLLTAMSNWRYSTLKSTTIDCTTLSLCTKQISSMRPWKSQVR